MRANGTKLGPEVGIMVGQAARVPIWSRGLELLSVLAVFPLVAAIVLITTLSSGVNLGLLEALVKWTPFIGEGFVLNVAMSLFAIFFGTSAVSSWAWGN